MNDEASWVFLLYILSQRILFSVYILVSSSKPRCDEYYSILTAERLGRVRSAAAFQTRNTLCWLLSRDRNSYSTTKRRQFSAA